MHRRMPESGEEMMLDILMPMLAVVGGVVIGVLIAMFGMRKVNKAYRSGLQDGCQLIGDARRLFVREDEPDRRQHDSKVAVWSSRTFDWERKYTELIGQSPREMKSPKLKVPFTGGGRG